MAWIGWFSYAGNEIINVDRTEAYARAAGLPWFKPVYKNGSLAPMLGETYRSPRVDDAPWTDPDFPSSFGFCGVYPLDITGIEDSSRSSSAIESVGDGGVVGKIRHGMKSVVFNAVLIGEDDAAVAYGFNWLKQALLSGPCGGGEACGGDDLCYLASEPAVDLDGMELTVISVPNAPLLSLDGGSASSSGGTVYDGDNANDDGEQPLDLDGGTAFATDGSVTTSFITTDVDPADCFTELQRSLRQVVVNSGPSITGKQTLSDGGAAWTVTFTAVAGEPWEYGAETPVIEGFLDPAVLVPWAGGVVPEGGYIDLDGHLFNETACAEPVYAPLEDPLCPATIPPPLPPSIALGCYTPPKNWRRRQITIPATYIPLWGEVVPKFAVHARKADLRNMRLRFYADVEGNGDISEDPCAYCGDLVVSYIPQGFTLVFDGSERQVYAFDASQKRRRADNIVFTTDGKPFDWPTLTCGMGYIVTLDLPQTQKPPVFDLSLFSRAA